MELLLVENHGIAYIEAYDYLDGAFPEGDVRAVENDSVPDDFEATFLPGKWALDDEGKIVLSRTLEPQVMEFTASEEDGKLYILSYTMKPWTLLGDNVYSIDRAKVPVQFEDDYYPKKWAYDEAAGEIVLSGYVLPEEPEIPTGDLEGRVASLEDKVNEIIPAQVEALGILGVMLDE